MFKVDLEFKFSHLTKDVYCVKLDICGIQLFLNSSKELLTWTGKTEILYCADLMSGTLPPPGGSIPKVQSKWQSKPVLIFWKNSVLLLLENHMHHFGKCRKYIPNFQQTSNIDSVYQIRSNSSDSHYNEKYVYMHLHK